MGLFGRRGLSSKSATTADSLGPMRPRLFPGVPSRTKRCLEVAVRSAALKGDSHGAFILFEARFACAFTDNGEAVAQG